ncbi:MAG TPA: hypothetical protein VK498_15815 [Ferruginibacter sp.]|nr:hypothetical protein [Ferruginibacter sp.]
MQKETSPWNTGPLFIEQGVVNNIPIKPYSVKEMCVLYNISYKTYFKWCDMFRKEIGPKKGRYYTIRQVRIIFERLGFPE